MKGTVLSNCEKNFILRAALELKRLDGRKLEDFRNIKVHFGRDWGLCYVSLGDTKILTQVTCEIQEPKTTRPNEGLIFINVELSSMAAPFFESSRSSDLSVHINRLLEKCIKDSRAVDLESLCIVAEEKVWTLRVDVNVLNHDGNLVDCASISVLAALAHFRRPDVTTDGEEIKIHSVLERDPIPITLHHYPVCVSFALLNNSENIFADPTAIEERVSDASLTFGINAYKEICCLHLGGIAVTKPNLILSCSVRASARAKEIVDIIKEALNNDSKIRESKQPVGFIHSLKWNNVTSLAEKNLHIQLNNFITQSHLNSEETKMADIDKFEIVDLGNNCAELNNSSHSHKKKNYVIKNLALEKQLESYGEGGPCKWEVDLKTPQLESDSDLDSSSVKEKDGVCEKTFKPKLKDVTMFSEDQEGTLKSENPNTAGNKKRKKTKKGKSEKSNSHIISGSIQSVKSKQIEKRNGT